MMPIFRPTIMKKRLVELTAEELDQMGVKGLLLDVDNTLAAHFDQTPFQGIPEWLEKMKKTGIRLTIVSNARGSRVEPFAERLGLSFECLCKKPLTAGVKRAIKRMGLSKAEVLLCGDQLFTDMLCGNLCRLKTLLLEPAMPEDTFNFKLKRALEKPLLKKYRKREER